MDLQESSQRRRAASRLLTCSLPMCLVWLSLLMLLLQPSFASSARWFGQMPSILKTNSKQRASTLKPWSATSGMVRGGGSTDESANEEADDERYSRQVYTLGRRAHSLIRSSTVYIDGPCESGLVYECAKNLALSGIGSIVVVTSTDDGESSGDATDSNYYDGTLDDLGKAYTSAAMTETGLKTTDADLLVSFIQRLNPSIAVRKVSRSELKVEQATNGIVLSIDRPYATQQALNRMCRDLDFAFVGSETAGVYARVFCDFGPSFEVHDMDGEAPLVVPFDHMEKVEGQDAALMIHCVEDERHDVSKGDKIALQVKGGETVETQLTVTRVFTPSRFSVEYDTGGDSGDSSGQSLDDFVKNMNDDAVSFSRVKIPQMISFLSLDEATDTIKSDGSLFSPCDLEKSFDDVRRDAIFSCFQTLSQKASDDGRDVYDGDESAFIAAAKKMSNLPSHNDAWMKHCQQFYRTCQAKFVPIQGIFGAVAAQESLKAASGLYTPIQQFLMYDCDEVLASDDDEEDKEAIGGASPQCTTSSSEVQTGLEHILGTDVYNDLRSKKLFVVGAGAIGCEVLKNLAAMNAGTTKKGCVIVTDMDTIERSNLSRQLLFRDGDIGDFKSIAAERAIHRFNPNMNIESHTSKVGDEETGPFDDAFWSKGYDIILNALDNMEARLYMDGQCVSNAKALVDAGTLGSKGNVQVVVPFQSESYGSSADPPEPSIPVCTLKNFPYMISHTIQWGRDLFDGFYARRPVQANEYASETINGVSPAFTSRLINKLSKEAAKDAAKELAEDYAVDGEYSVSDEVDMLRQDALSWASSTANELFHDAIQDLLTEHPPDSLDDDDEPFWSGSRRTPTPLRYDDSDTSGLDPQQQQQINECLVDFVKYAGRLRLEMYSETARDDVSLSTISTQQAVEALSALPPSSHGNGKVNSSNNEDDSDSDDETAETTIRKHLGSIPSGTKREMFVAEFEKDDDANGHVAFVTAASNLRALCYGIAPVDAMETRRVAGRIVPAMITTTAFVSAVSCLEYIKLVQGVPLRRHRNAFINLALPFFAFTAPLPAEEVRGFRDESYTLWDKIVLKESRKASENGGLKLQHVLKKLARTIDSDDPSSVEVTAINYGPYMIYADFLHGGDMEVLNKNIWSLIRESIQSGQAFDDASSRDGGLFGIGEDDDDDDGGNADNVAISLSGDDLAELSKADLTVMVEDMENGEEVELPPIQLIKFKHR